MSIDPAKLESTVGLILRLLADGAYSELERISAGTRLSAVDIQRGIHDVPGTITSELRFNLLDIVEIESPGIEQWSVNVPICTDQEHPSDLTLSLTLSECGHSMYRVEIDDLHVL